MDIAKIYESTDNWASGSKVSIAADVEGRAERRNNASEHDRINEIMIPSAFLQHQKAVWEQCWRTL